MKNGSSVLSVKLVRLKLSHVVKKIEFCQNWVNTCRDMNFLVIDFHMSGGLLSENILKLIIKAILRQLY